MKSKEKILESPRVKFRQPLQDVTPISTPFLVYVDITNACNFSCEFCPTGNPDLLKAVGRPLGHMDYGLFTQIIDEFREFDEKIKRIFLAKDGEPLLHKRLFDMIRYTKQAGISEIITTTTNGARLNEEVNFSLVDAGLDLLTISVEAVSNKQYQNITHTDFDYDTLVEHVAHLYQHRQGMKICTKIIDWNLSETEKEKFYRDFRPISDFTYIDFPRGWSNDSVKDFTLGTNPTGFVDLPNMDPKSVCPWALYSLAINLDGSVGICCVDWSYGTVVGNLKEETLLEIWNGKRMYEFRKMHLTHRRSENKACGDCYTINGLPDNIDAYAKIILEKLTSAQGE